MKQGDNLKQMIKQVNPFEFILEMAAAFPNSAKYHALTVLKNGGVLFCAFDGNKITGVAMLNTMGYNTLDVFYLYICEPYRKMGIALALLKYCTEYVESLHKSICFRIIKENSFSNVYEKLTRKNNYIPEQSVHIYICHCNEKNNQNWMNFWNSKGRKICEKLCKEGYETKSFADAPLTVMTKLQDGIGSKFPSNLNPFSLTNRSDEWSFVSYKDNQPAAFSTATLVGEKLIFEQLASGYEYRNNGTFFPPFSYIMNSAFQKSISRITCIVYDDNQNMIKLMNKFMPVIDEVKHQVIYRHS
jgi:hypothetical protein